MSSPPPTSPPPMVWPGPPGGNVVPFPLPWGQTGCCPPGGMDALMKCYCDIQAATAFICSVMVQCVQNNPAVTEAIIAAIEASGSSLPTMGVTNGSNAQPGQVGEFVPLNLAGSFPTGSSTQLVSLGVLQPGDWNVEGIFAVGGAVNSVYTGLSPTPAGFSWNLAGYQAVAAAPSGASESVLIPLTPTRASISVPTLLPMTVVVDAGSNPGGAFQFVVNAWRMR